MDIISDAAVSLDDISSFYSQAAGIHISMLRLDKLHPVISGNKWYKLRYNLVAALQGGYRQLITFGGAYSNHLVATAAAAQLNGLAAVAVVRGLHAQQNLTPTLKACLDYGMQLHFVSREEYDHKKEPHYLHRLLQQFGRAYIIPEGGDNEDGRRGTADIAALIPGSMTHVCLPVGTGTTFAGIRNVLPGAVHMTGFTAIKGGQYLEPEIRQHLSAEADCNWHLEDRFHFGGFARTTAPLLHFTRDFYTRTGIRLDIVYTGKMMAGLSALLEEGHFAPGARICCIHTGGLQGNPDGLFPV